MFRSVFVAKFELTVGAQKTELLGRHNAKCWCESTPAGVSVFLLERRCGDGATDGCCQTEQPIQIDRQGRQKG